jgi:hypothetical protein
VVSSKVNSAGSSPERSDRKLSAARGKGAVDSAIREKRESGQSLLCPRQVELVEPTKKDLMISKIISRAACLAERTSNPKSFFNCPDLHGGSCSPGARFRSEEIRLLDPAGNLEETITFSDEADRKL